jgi:hypothetical protein
VTYSAEDSLRAVLLGNAAVVALVIARVYPMQLPEIPTLPAITYQRVATPDRALTTTSDSKLFKARFLINCWAATYTGARALGAAAVTALSRYQGPYASDIQVIEDMDGEDPETSRKRVILGIYLWSK